MGGPFHLHGSRRRKLALWSIAGLSLVSSEIACNTRRADLPQSKPAPVVATPATSPSTRASAPFAAIDVHGLPNAHRVTRKVIAGAQPEGDAAFAALRDMGVRTII